MPQYNRNDLEIAARNQHFTRDTFEKVLRLKTILDWMNAHEFLRAHLLLKGGTAINLTIFELPRLSVDIDMDFVPNLPREDMLQARETISGTIKEYMDSEGYAFSLSDSSTRLKRFLALSIHSSLDKPLCLRGNMILSITVLEGIRLKCWKIIPIFFLSSLSCLAPRDVISIPSIFTVPDVGFTKRLMHLTNVDFPAPEKPIIP